MDKKYEQLVEYIISDETDKAKELFHDIVVSKSREIWESMESLEADSLEDDIQADQEMAPVDEASEDEVTDMMGDMESDGEEITDMDDMDDQADSDDMADMGDAELEDRVMDLEDALDELKAEFDALMADEEGEAEHHDGSMDPDFGAEEGEEEEEEGEEDEDEIQNENAVSSEIGKGDNKQPAKKAFDSAAESDELGAADVTKTSKEIGLEDPNREKVADITEEKWEEGEEADPEHHDVTGATPGSGINEEEEED